MELKVFINTSNMNVPSSYHQMTLSRTFLIKLESRGKFKLNYAIMLMNGEIKKRILKQ